MVVDVGSPNTPVIYASPSIDITKEIIELYDKSTAEASGPAAHQGCPGYACFRNPVHPPSRPANNSHRSGFSVRVELASGRKLRDRNKPAYRLAHWPIWIFVFFIAPGPSTFDLFAHGFDRRELLWLALVIVAPASRPCAAGCRASSPGLTSSASSKTSPIPSIAASATPSPGAS